MQVKPSQTILVDGKPIPSVSTDRFVIMYHKPEGEICTRQDPKCRPTIFDRFTDKALARLISIGRLDFNTSGLLLLTNDGDFGHQIAHPSSEVEREYLCRVHGHVNRHTLERLHQGVKLDGRLASFKSIKAHHGTHPQATNQSFSVVIAEGRYREVRRLWEQVDCTVTRLKRIRVGTLSLPRSLRAGQWAYLSDQQITQLHKISQTLPKHRRASKNKSNP